MSQRRDFFRSPAEHSLIKLRFLEKYLVPWSSKVGSPKSVTRLCVVDGFCGPGRYKDKTPGSGERILAHARQVALAHRGYSIAPILIEQTATNFRSLKSVVEEYADVRVMLRRGDFYSMIDEIIDYVAGDPLLLVIDPFGLKDLHLGSIARLARRSSMCDLIVTFFTSAAARLEAQYGDYLTRALGPGSENDDPAARFSRNMATAGSFWTAGRFKIRQDFDAAAKYEHLFFARRCDAYQLANDFLTDEHEGQRRKKETRADQPALGNMLESTALDRDTQAAVDVLLKWARSREPFLRRELRCEFYVNRYATFNTKILDRALKLLADQQVLEHGPGLVDKQVWRLR